MSLSRDKYVVNNIENREKLINHIIENASVYDLRDLAQKELENHYSNEDQHFLDDYYETFPDEDPEVNGVQEEEVTDKIIYYHGHHSNPCVVGEIHLPEAGGCGVIMITHDILFDEDYGDNLSDITKIWDCHVQCEVYNSRYDTDPDTCIHIPLDIGEHTVLANQVLKLILLNNNVDLVKIQHDGNQFTLEAFFVECLGIYR